MLHAAPDSNPPTCSSSVSASAPCSPLVVAYGGGTNSTAMLCGFKERGIVPSLILFADTGGELPYTYDHVTVMSAKTMEWWGVPIEMVRKTYQGGFEGLEGQSLRHHSLPSLAYGRRSCSVKYKNEPQTRRLRAWMDEHDIKEVVKAIGFDSGEPHRVKKINETLGKDRKAEVWYPLVEWGWDRAKCAGAILRHGLPQPGKSSCFFCPAMKQWEILRLKREHPDYFERALKIESNAILRTKGRGLGGASLRWENVDRQDTDQGKLWSWVDEHAPTRVPCGCYDGGSDSGNQ